MQQFWLKLLLYIMPFAIGFVTLTGGMIYIGESMPLGWVIARQDSDDFVLYRPRYGNRDFQYKQLATEYYRAPVLAIGSSRILQFRAGFLTRNSDAFYNAAAPAWTLDEVTEFLYTLDPSAYPDTLLLALDLPWYNDNYVGDVFPEPISDFANFFLVNRSFLQDVVQGDDFDTDLYMARIEPATKSGLALGMRAIRDGHGFRNDGSEQFGDYLVAGWLWQPQQRERHLDLMRECDYVYPCGQTISTTQIEETRQLLAWAREQDIQVIGFLPSYAPTLWNEMANNPEYTYIRPTRDALSALFAEFQYPFFDYSNGEWLGLSDEDFFDGWHASEKGNLALFIQLVTYVPELAEYADLDSLKDIFASSGDTWRVFVP
jgi:hypothetical protein